MVWQRRARWGVALFAVAFAIGVFYAMGERPTVGETKAPPRQDPKASLELAAGVLTRLAGADESFAVDVENYFAYPDRSLKLDRPRIRIKNRHNRDFTITAQSGLVAPDDKGYDLKQNIVLKASDGLEIHTDDASYSRADHIVRAPGSVTFTRGKMAGAGVGMTYDVDKEILTLTSASRVAIYNDAGEATTSFESGSSSLDRLADVLTLDGTVHMLRDQQEFDAERAIARLSEDEAFVRYVELRGDARVTGGGSLDAMSARDIDLDYSDDGQVMERVILAGEAGVAVKGAEGSPAREIHGDRLDLELAKDGTLTKATGQNGVRLQLPADGKAAPRAITAKTLEATGAPGKGLTSVRFDDTVVYKEAEGTASAREANSQSLRLALDDAGITDAAFTGRTTFRDGTLTATADDARYSPARGTLGLKGGTPTVRDENVVINGDAIDVAFETRQMTAKGNAKTTYSGTRKSGPDTAESKMPGLLKANEAVTVTAASLDYSGSRKVATYTGNVTLRQGVSTNIRATQELTLDQGAGDLTAIGGVRATFVNDRNEQTQANADEVRYTDKTRMVRYSTTAPGQSRVDSATGDLRAARIDITLEKDSSNVARIVAQPAISIRVDQRTVTGARLEYTAADGNYVVDGDARSPVRLTDRTGTTCVPASGMRLTITKGTEGFKLEGAGTSRPRTGGAGTCAPTR